MRILAFVCSLVSCVLAILLMRFPKQVIETQVVLYRMNKWKLEPMFWENEQKRMIKIGMLLAVLSFLGFINYLSLLQLDY